MSTKRFQGRYEVNDGYMGGSRPQYFSIDASDIMEDATDDELISVYEDCMEEHFQQNIGPSGTNTDEFLEWAHGVIEAKKS